MSKVNLFPKKNSPYSFILALILGAFLAIGGSVLATSIGSNVDVSGTLTSSGAATLSSTVTVSGAGTFNGNVTLGDAATDTFTVTGNSITYSNAGTTTIPSASAVAWAYATSSASVPFVRYNTSTFRIGIGTTTPGATFAVGGAGNIYALGGIGIGLATTTAGAIENSGNVLFGDASTDLAMFNSASLIYNNQGTTTIPAANAASWAYATSSANIPFVRYDTSNYRIGIGTTTPGATFAVGGAGNIYALGGIGAGLATTTAGALETSGAGLIGGAFNVTGAAVLNGNVTLGDATADVVTFTSGDHRYSNAGTTTIPDSNANSWAYATSSSAGPAFVRLDTAAVFVGIATNTPSATLDIGGDGSLAVTAATGTATSSLRMQSRGTTRGACIELESADGTATFRLYATSTTNTNQGGVGYAPAVFELGSCR